MSKKLDLTGQKFGRLTCLECVKSNKKGNVKWLCKCDCGNKKIVRGSHIKKGLIKSCGCFRKEIKTGITHGLSIGKNGKPTRLFRIWCGMKQRCLDSNSSKFYLYGSRGITICQEWMDYKVFYTWAMSNGYKNNLTIERKNNNGNYTSDNCEWIPAAQQARNKRTNHFIIYKGERKTLAEWCEILQINHSSLLRRLKNWTLEKALNTPAKKDKRRIINEN